MNDVQEINVGDIMAQIREHLPNPQRPPAVSATAPSSNGLVAAELTSLQSTQDVCHFRLTSHRKFVGPFIVFAKKVVRKLLTPSLERQSWYNAANLRLALHLSEHAEAIQKLGTDVVAKLKERGQELTAQVNEVRQELSEQHERYQELAEQIGAVHQEQVAALQAIRGVLAEQIGAAHQEQAAALQALRGKVSEQIGSVHRDLQVLQEDLTAQIQEKYQEQAAGLQTLRDQTTIALREMRERSSRAERRLRRFVAGIPEGPNADPPAAKQSLPHLKTVLAGTAELDFDYFGFEERFRGSEEDIKERDRVYVEFFKEANQVLDVGCGRGEFLELLTEAGIKAKGVDLDLDMVLYCQEKGLDVVQEDAYTYLEGLPDASLGGLFAAQVAEHLEPTRIIELVHLCQRKLQAGGVLIFETPNPICLTVFARSFYMDFSHIRPIHPEAMKFLFESAGFHDLQVKFSSPVEPSMRIPPLSGAADGVQATEEFNRGIERLNELLYGFQDYAVIGRKSLQL
jgi:SAM-dependent methyltransferase